MGTQILKDAHYQVVGFIDTHPDGSQTGKNSHYQVVGYYDPRGNVTKDSHYRVVGSGNLIASLIHCT